jgi:hypothetical protein
MIKIRRKSEVSWTGIVSNSSGMANSQSDAIFNRRPLIIIFLPKARCMPKRQCVLSIRGGPSIFIFYHNQSIRGGSSPSRDSVHWLSPPESGWIRVGLQNDWGKRLGQTTGDSGQSPPNRWRHRVMNSQLSHGNRCVLAHTPLVVACARMRIFAAWG